MYQCCSKLYTQQIQAMLKNTSWVTEFVYVAATGIDGGYWKIVSYFVSKKISVD